jgi:hypothetical protein
MTRLNRIRGLLTGLLCLSLTAPVTAQVITSFTPKYGSAGDNKIEISGSGFATGTITVRFWNGVVATGRYVNSDTKITVTNVPAGIATGPISVQRNSGAQNYSPDIFTVVGPGPFISDVTPAYGTSGDLVYINGVHLKNASAVKFAGINAASFYAPNPDGFQVIAYVPTGNTNGPITVTTPLGTTNSPENFTVVGAGPYVASFAPDAGAETTPVTILGINFTGLTYVRFNGQSAAWTSFSDTIINVPAPGGVTTGPITVITSAGSNTTSQLFYGPLRLTGFSPVSGPVGTQVTLSGTNFTGATTVKFGGFTGVPASFVVSNNNRIVVTVPTNAPTGTIAISTPSGSLAFTTNFVVTPSITGFTPQAGAAGTPVQITGTRLVDNGGGAPTVQFNGTNATVTSWNAQQVIATAPASSSGFITLTTADGSSTTASPFYYPPRITGISPNTNPSGSTVTITGQSLTNASSVLFNGVPSTNVTVLSNTSIQAKVPTGFTTGPVTVTTPGGTTNSSPLLYYAAPVISAFAPDGGGPGTSVTVFGSSFQGATAVKFNGVSASFNNVTGTQLTAVVPSGASTGPISVTAPAGTATSAEVFVVPQLSDLRVNTFLHVPNPVTVGEDLTLTIVPSNDGPDTASNVTASVTVAAGLVVKSAWSTTPGVTVNTNGNPVVFQIPRMTLFDNPSLKLVLVPQAEGLVTNRVVLSSAMFDPGPEDNASFRITTVLPAATLTIATSDPNLVRVAWPAALTNWTLQSTLDLTNSALWSNVPTPPVVEGSERVVTEPGTGAARFYRLSK